VLVILVRVLIPLKYDHERKTYKKGGQGRQTIHPPHDKNKRSEDNTTPLGMQIKKGPKPP